MGSKERDALTREEKLFHYVRDLSFPRPTGSEAERRAAEYVKSMLEGLGLDPRIEVFTAVSDMNWFPISAGIASLVGAFVGVFFSPLSGALISVFGPFLFWHALVRADSPIRGLLPRVESTNVVARIPPEGKAVRKVAVAAHLDTNRVRLAWASEKAAAIRWGTLGTLVAYLLIPVFLTISAVTGVLAWAFAAGILGLYALGTIGFLLYELRNPHSPGAIDNASSVAVALGLAEEFAVKPLRNTELWLCFTGAEEVDHRGIKELLRRYHHELSGAYFLVLEGVGAGELSLVTEEGVLTRYRPDPELLGIAAGVSRAHPELGIIQAPMSVVCETQTLRRLGYKALTLAGRDPSTGTLHRWHSVSDLPDGVSPGKLSRALSFMRLLIFELDKHTS